MEVEKKRRCKKISIIIIIILFIGLAAVFGINIYVKSSTTDKIISADEAVSVNADCILVLGAGVNGSEPSLMLSDRISTAVDLYKSGAARVILMSGDHGTVDYDEVNTMKERAITRGVPSSKIFMDHAGFSTYDSLYRTGEIFGAKKIIIVSQTYHLYRAIYIAGQLGIEAYGVSADHGTYARQNTREIRELLARDKDVIKCLFKPEPKYLGDKILLSGSGDVTNDR